MAGISARVTVGRVLREPFTAATWRRTAYAVLALPVGLVPHGGRQRAPLRTLLGVHVMEGPRLGPLRYTLLATPLNLLVAALTLYGWSLVPMNLAWPLRAGDDPASAWGGPTFAGAWAFHALLGGIGPLLLMPWAVRAATAAQTRLAVRLLGPAHGAARPTARDPEASAAGGSPGRQAGPVPGADRADGSPTTACPPPGQWAGRA